MALFLFEQACRAQEVFPEWRVAPVMLSGSWERAQHVVVGDVDNVVSIGSQPIPNPPPWPGITVSDIYWCRADFHASSVIKGTIPPAGKKLLWAAMRPGCGLEYAFYGYQGADPPLTRIWFIREEGDYLRPAVDSGGVYFVSIHVKWPNPPKGEAARLFALLLLNPAVLGGALSANSLDLFTLILGEDGAGERLRALAAGTRDDHLRRWVCDYLRSSKYACQ